MSDVLQKEKDLNFEMSFEVHVEVQLDNLGRMEAKLMIYHSEVPSLRVHCSSAFSPPPLSIESINK